MLEVRGDSYVASKNCFETIIHVICNISLNTTSANLTEKEIGTCFFYKNNLYNRHQAEIRPKNKNNLQGRLRVKELKK